MLIFFSSPLLFLTIITSSLVISTSSVLPALNQEELNALEKIATTLGIKGLNLSHGDPCSLGYLEMMQANGGVSSSEINNTIGCECSFNNNTTCHITSISLKNLSLQGKLPPELAKLRYLQSIDLNRNYLSGTIPMEWASMPYLNIISLSANRLSGNLPSGLQNFTNLISLGVEANQFSGSIPDGLGNLTNLTQLHLSSNQFTGSLPNTLARLVNLKEFKVSDNNLNGIIPEYIGNWSQLQILRLYASGLKGPIPDAVARLQNLAELIITDTPGINSFPIISSQVLRILVLRNVTLSGQIPSYIWYKPVLKTLDISFNMLTGEFHPLEKPPKYTYLTGNMLSGYVGSGVFLDKKSFIDLSYNNFSWPSNCHEKSNINTYRSSYLKKKLTGLLPCAGPISCPSYHRSLHINCGGGNVTVTNSLGKIAYQADNSETRATTNHHTVNWGMSSTGHSPKDLFTKTTTFTLPGDSPVFYQTARSSPISLAYYAFCLENGTYNVKLHFMEIQFSDKELYLSLIRRIFDVYVQGVLIWKDFNIKEEANGTLKPVVKEVDANVSNHLLEIRLHWAGKGTTDIVKGLSGPLISAISLCHREEPRCGAEKTIHHMNNPLIWGLSTIAALVVIILLALGIYAWKSCKKYNNKRRGDLRALGLQTVCFTWTELQAATNNFDQANKLGEGGFGSVFKGELYDGTIIAVKQLSSMSRQGNREFVNEIGMISGLNHPNLVKLYGCCVEKNQLLLVYEYLENNSLALSLYGKSPLKINWEARQKICVGIAKGLDFLHGGSMIRMVHRDIKTTNVLLDADMNAKISDFGLARLHEAEHTHISTKIAGTIGYMAPEYALWGQLTEKADVYSFGIVAMEIVSGKSNTTPKGRDNHISLINWALTVQKKGDIMEIVDPMLEGNFNKKEAMRMITVALVCTNSSPSLRPTMSEVVQMLEGEIEITQVMSDPSMYGHDLSFSKLMEMIASSHTPGGNEMLSSSDQLAMTSLVSGYDVYPLNSESTILNSTTEASTSSM